MKLEELLSLVAYRLSGSPVVVRLRMPVFRPYDGFCYKSLSGKIVIDVRPDLEPDVFLRLFLHEVGHVKKHHPRRFNRINVDLPEHSQVLPGWQKAVNYASGRESEADRQAGEWFSFAARNYQYYSGESILERKLKALYERVDFAGMIEDAVQKAVKSMRL